MKFSQYMQLLEISMKGKREMELLKRFMIARQALDSITPFIATVGRNMSDAKEFNADAAFDLAKMEEATDAAVKALYALNNAYYEAYELLKE